MIKAWKRFAAYGLISLAILVSMELSRADGASETSAFDPRATPVATEARASR